MTDLRTGLVEAVAVALFNEEWLPARDRPTWDEEPHKEYWVNSAAAALDAALGFLTDNAEATKAMQRGLGALPLDDRYDHSRNARHLLHAFLAALSDTGEKP